MAAALGVISIPVESGKILQHVTMMGAISYVLCVGARPEAADGTTPVGTIVPIQIMGVPDGTDTHPVTATGMVTDIATIAPIHIMGAPDGTDAHLTMAMGMVTDIATVVQMRGMTATTAVDVCRARLHRIHEHHVTS